MYIMRLCKIKKTQTEIWVKFFLVVCETVVTLSYTNPNS